MLALFLVVLTTSNGVGIGLSLGYYIAETVILIPILAIFDWSDQVFAYLLGPNVGAWQSVPGTVGVTPPPASPPFGGNCRRWPTAPFSFPYMSVVLAAAAAIALFLRRDIAGVKGG